MPLSRNAIRSTVMTTKAFKTVLRPKLKNAVRFSPTTERIFTHFDRNKLITRMRSVVEQNIRATSLAYHILAAVRSPGIDRFGLSSHDRLWRARTRFLQQIGKVANRGVQQRWAVGNVVDHVYEIIDKQSPFQALIAYEAARTDNLSVLQVLEQEGVQFVTIRLSPAHTTTDICNEFAGRYPIGKVDLPPYHPYCRCYVTLD